MINRLKFRDGWNGGEYLLNDKNITFRKKPKAILIINGKEYPAEYEIINGTDDDMGHNYPWQKMGIGVIITDGNLSSFLLIDELPKNTKIYLKYI